MTTTNQPIYPNYHPNSLVPAEDTIMVQNFPSSFLTEITVNIVNTNSQRRPSKIGFKAEVCVENNCCQTAVLFKRGGFFKFSGVFQNLGECSQIMKDENKEVRVRAIRTSRGRTSLQVLSITARFYDGSLLIAEDVREDWWGRSQQYYLSWGRSRGTRLTDVGVGTNLPNPHCPEILTPNANVCPKANIRVHDRLQDERKFCYYQE